MVKRCSLWLMLILGFLLTTQPCWAAPTMALPTVAPAAITRGVPATVRVSSMIEGSDHALIPGSVNLLKVDASGKTIAILGTLKDNGAGGDVTAGDFIYSGTFTLNESSQGIVRLRVSAAFKGQLKRVLSEISTLQVLPAGFPNDVRQSDMTKAVYDPETGTQFLGNEVIAFFRPETDPDTVNQVVSSVQGKVVGLLAGFKLNGWQIEIPGSGAEAVRNAISTLAQAPEVQGAEPNGVLEGGGVVPNDPAFGQQWGLTRIRADVAWAIGRSSCLTCHSTPVSIGIVDSGVNYNDPDLAGKVTLGRNFVHGNNDPMDDNGHGTHVAGIASAHTNNAVGISGTAPNSTIVAVKVLDSTLAGFTTDVALGIKEAVDLGARVINLSLGGSDASTSRLQTLANAIDYANRRGRVVVSIAHNYGCGIKRWYPAGFDDTYQYGATVYNTRVISVGATDQNDQVAVWNAGRPACDDNPNTNPPKRGYMRGSNYGDWVDIYAPGTAIRSINPTYPVPNGTSFAAPFVSGTAALLLQIAPNLTVTQIKNTLINTAEERGTQDPAGRYIKRLNAFKAVFQTAARTCVACPESPDVSVGGGIWDSPWVEMGTTSGGTQNMSVHGISVPLVPATNYDVQISYRLFTSDYYYSGRYADSFSVSTSPVPYWQLTLTDPLNNNPSLSLGFLWGNSLSLPPGWEATNSGTTTVTMQGGVNNILNIVLDTATLPDADGLGHSTGIIDILDITPH